MVSSILAAALLAVSGTQGPPLQQEAETPAAKAWTALQGEFEASEVQGYKEKADAFSPRYREFADRFAGTPEGLRALFVLFGDCWWLRDQGESHMHEAAALLAQEILKTYPDAPGLDGFVDRAYVMDGALKQAVFGKLRGSSHAAVRAAGTLGLARTLEREGQEGAERSRALYDELVEKYADVKIRYSTYGEIAEAVLHKHSAEELEIGQPAPDILGRDADGTPMKLSDYRGKVVVIDFWGDW